MPFTILKDGPRPDVLGNSGSIPVFSRSLLEVITQFDHHGLVLHDAVIYDKHDSKIVYSDVAWVKPPVGSGPQEARGASLLFDRYSRPDGDPSGEDPDEVAKHYGIYFDPASWTGVDIFRMPRGSKVIITQRVVVALKDRGFKAMSIVPVGEYGREIARLEAERIRNKRKKGRP